MSDRPPNYGAPWTEDANQQLVELFDAGHSVQEIAAALGRNENGIVGQLVRLNKVANVNGHIYRLDYWYDNRRNARD